jgi:hypothetical protein
MPDNNQHATLLGLFVGSMLAAKPTVLAEFKFFRLGFLVFGGGVISLLALGTGKRNDISHCNILCMN